MKTKKITETDTKKLAWKTPEQVFKKSIKKPVFHHAYHVEKERIRIANAIRAARVEKRITQATVAKRAQMPQSVIARLESGGRSVSLDTLSRVARALGKQVELV